MATGDLKYDFFLSHAGPDAGTARLLYGLLRDHSSVFFDEACLEPGEPFPRVLQEAQLASLITVVLISRHTPSAWYQGEEITVAIELARRPGSSRRIVPVYLEGAPERWEEVPFGLRNLEGIVVSDRLPLDAVARLLLDRLRALKEGEPTGPAAPTCLLLAGAAPLDPALDEAVARAAEDAGLQLRRGAEFVGSGGPPGLGLDQAVRRAMAVVVVGTRVPRKLAGAMRGRPCLLVAFGEGRGPARHAKSSRPNRVRLVHAGSPDDLRREVAVWLRAALQEVAEWVHAAGSGAATAATRIPPKLFDLPLELRTAAHEVRHVRAPSSVAELFRDELPAVDRGRRVVVTGPPGSGKSVLVARYCAWLARRGRGPSDVSSADHLPSFAVVLRPADLERLFTGTGWSPAPAPLAERLWAAVAARTADAARGDDHLAGMIVPLRDHGRLHVVVDGFDEFASRNAGELRAVLDALDELAWTGANVMVACRENFWSAQVGDDPRFGTRLRLLEIGGAEARMLLQEIPLPPAARSSDGDIEPWLRSPLLIRFLRDLHQGGDPPSLYEAVVNRTAVYRKWAEWVAEQAARTGVQRFAEVCTEVALRFVELRRFELDAGYVLEHVNRNRGPREPLTSSHLDALEVFARATDPERPGSRDDAVRFQHETILEYFATAGLSREFLAVVDGAAVESLHGFRLASLTLDHFQSSVYGFLDETLGRGYQEKLVRYLSGVRVAAIPTYLLRNLVEYLGLTARDGSEQELSKLLLSMMEDFNLPPLIRFNVARALERIHPCAPRPYFEYVSDWGTTDFASFRRRQITRPEEAPWVIRGLKALAPELGRHVTFAPNDRTRAMDDALQREISGRLLAILERLTTAPADEEFVRVNASLALVRWFHHAHTDRLLALQERYRRQGIGKAACENLERWVPRL